MNLEGRLRLSLQVTAGQIVGARIASERPVFAGRILEGRRPAVALATIALLFSLCGKAQTVALAEAIEAASTKEASTELRCQRQLMVVSEAAREHLWRFAMDLPQCLGLAPQTKTLVALRKVFDPVAVAGGNREGWWDVPLNGAREAAWHQLAEDLDALLVECVFGETPVRWLDRQDRQALEEWIAASPTPPAQAFGLAAKRDFGDCRLPWLTIRDAETLWPKIEENSRFAKCPALDGRPAETGALARCAEQPQLVSWLGQRGRGPAARLLARLIELARAPAQIRQLAAGRAEASIVRAFHLPNGGAAAVETARGLLLHSVRLAEGEIASITIVAPTEWNFHPEGAWVRGLIGTSAETPAAARSRAALLAHALDPCVAWEIEVEHA